MKHKLESRLLGEISTTSDMQMTPSLQQKIKELKSFLMTVKEKSEKMYLKLNIQKTNIMASGPISLIQFSSVTQLCVNISDLLDCSKPGLPVHYQLLKFTQTHVHCVSVAIKPSHLLSSPSFPSFNLSSIRAFSNELVLQNRWPKHWSFSITICPSSE